MTKRLASSPYFTLFRFDPEHSRWFDEFGAFDLEEVRGEVEFSHYDTPRKHLRIVRHRYDAGSPAIAFDLDATGKTTLGTIQKLKG